METTNFFILMKKYFAFILFAGLLISCNTETKKPVEPINISVFIDLSDRLIRDMEPSQMSRDTAIVGYLADYFKSVTLGPQILQSKDNMKVFFYPTPQNSDIATLAQGLSVDMSALQVADKKKAVLSMKKNFQSNLAQIYSKAIDDGNNHKWPGCDIWDFFSSKKVDVQCIRKGYRNIIVILTDGYLYEENNKQQDGHAFSFVLPQTLKDPQSSLIVSRSGLEDLEVRILEVNPYSKEEGYKLVPILENWLKDMGVKEITVAETDLPVNTQTIIKSFLK